MLRDLGGVKQRFLRFELGGLDALGDLDFLLARQQGTWPICLRYMRTGCRGCRSATCATLLLASSWRCCNPRPGRARESRCRIIENGEDVVDFLLVLNRFRQCFVDIVKGQVTLPLRLADQLADFFVQVAGDHGQHGLGPLLGRMHWSGQGLPQRPRFGLRERSSSVYAA